MDDSVENRVGKRRFPNFAVPSDRRELRNEYRRTSSVACFDNFEQITRFVPTQGRQQPFV
jgi:hypothetical protein